MARFTAKDYLAQVKALFEGAKKSLDEADYAAFVEDAETFVETEAAEVFDDEDEDGDDEEEDEEEDDDEEEADEGAPDVPEV